MTLFDSMMRLILLVVTPTTSIFTNSRDPALVGVYENIGLDPNDYTIHDPSRIITVGRKQLIAVTGKENADGYTCGLETWWRNTGSSLWKPSQCLFEEKPGWIDTESPDNDGAFWAPELDLSDDGVLTMLYSVSESQSETPHTCVGIAKAVGGLDGFPNSMTWEDTGSPLTCIIGSDYDEERSAIDPSVFHGFGNDDEKLFLVTGGGKIIGTELNPETYQQLDGEWFDTEKANWYELAGGPTAGENMWVEAAYIHPNAANGFYYLFVNWGACCSGVDSTYNIMVGRSENPMGPYVDKNGVGMIQGGGTLFLDSGDGDEDYMIGPGHVGVWRDAREIDFVSFHYYDDRRDGKSWIAEKRLKWENGWPKTNRIKRAYPKFLLK